MDDDDDDNDIWNTEVSRRSIINPLNAELNPIGYLLELLGAHHILHLSRVRVKDIKK